MEKKGAEVVGVSTDSVEKLAKFKSEFNLPFVLLSDPDKKTLADYGAYGEKVMYGKKVMGVLRSTFVIDAEGKVLKAFVKVKPQDHAREIMELLDI